MTVGSARSGCLQAVRSQACIVMAAVSAACLWSTLTMDILTAAEPSEKAVREGRAQAAGDLPAEGLSSPFGAKKLIWWGWGSPDAKKFHERIGELEQLPFDGVVVEPVHWLPETPTPFEKRNSDDRAADTDEQRKWFRRLDWMTWAKDPIPEEWMTETRRLLADTKPQKLTDNFLRFNVTAFNRTGRGTIDEYVDWFEPEFDSSVLKNARLFARTAREAGLTGLMLDTEMYLGDQQIFNYATARYRDERAFKDYEARVREGGRRFMEALCAAYPDITVIITFTTQMAVSQGDLSQFHYGLLPAFCDGLVAGAHAEAMLVDGYEYS